MATVSEFATRSETASRPASSPFEPTHHLRHPELCRRLAACVLLAATLAPAASAQVPGIPSDEEERAWYLSFMKRFNARVTPSFRVDPEVHSRVARAWDAMVLRLSEGEELRPSPFEQYPLLGFVDSRFVVMRARTPRGEETFVVRSDEALAMPTLTSTLTEYLDGSIYASLQAIAQEEKSRVLADATYQPRLEQLAAQNPYQHGLPIRVPDMGPFKNRMVAFSGLGGRLTAADTADYEQRKWQAGNRQVVGVMRPQRWGVAVELVDLEQDGRAACRYRLVREVAAVRDTFVGEGRRGVLLRQPRLGPVIEVSGCVSDCESAESWTRIYPEATASPRVPAGPRPAPMAPPLSVLATEPGLLPPG
jgi:hypothetical protein